MRKLFFGIIASLALSMANAASMSVRVERPDLYKLMNQNSAWNIFLDGEIDSTTPKRVAEALAKTGSDGADVYINSPGGNLLAGMKIGTLIRQAGANTYIGSLIPDPTFKIGGKVGLKPIPGGCYSACSLAFLGGVYRYAIGNSQFGVHRFSSSSPSTENDLDTAQIISAAVSNYIRDMGVDPALFDLMVESGKDDIRLLSKEELTSLNVVNNGRQLPHWSIEVVEGGEYLRGVQDTVYGEGKGLFSCAKQNVIFQSFYQIGAQKAKSVAAGGWYHSLLIDGKTAPLPEPAAIKANGDEIYSLFILSKQQAVAISSARRFGHAMQIGRDAPTFVGYQIDIPPASALKVSAFIKNCYRP
jgi:hypothetical protein